MLRGFRQFDAPVRVIIAYDRVLDGSDDTPCDCGAVATTLVNVAWSRELDAVINSQGIVQSPVVREILCTVTVTAARAPSLGMQRYLDTPMRITRSRIPRLMPG